MREAVFGMLAVFLLGLMFFTESSGYIAHKTYIQFMAGWESGK